MQITNNAPLLNKRSRAEIRNPQGVYPPWRAIRNSLVGLLVALAFANVQLAWAQDAPAPAKDQPRVYVPYKDLGTVVDSVGKAVLMDRAEFDKLLAAADANAAAANSLELGQVSASQYAATVTGQALHVSGTLKLTSLSDRPVAVPLEFAQIGLTSLTLDDKPAPLGYDRQGRLAVIVTGKGDHTLILSGTASLAELASGGVQFTISLPAAAASTMTLTAPGDLEIHANVPVSTPVYSKETDRTATTITFGGPVGQNQLAVTLQGNGRAEDQRAIILGQSNTAITLNHAGQSMDCQFNVHVLRRGVRELVFELDEAWTITDVQCPNMVKWSISQVHKEGQKNWPSTQTLTVSLKSASRGSQVVRISAWAPSGTGVPPVSSISVGVTQVSTSSPASSAQSVSPSIAPSQDTHGGDAHATLGALEWTSPTMRLVGADYQRGFLLVDAGEELKFKSESFTDARRENVSPALQASSATGPLGVIAATSRLYSHWGEKWQVKLELAALEGRSTSDERQTFVISDKDLTLAGDFAVTALAKDLYNIAIEIPSGADSKDAARASQFSGWNLESVLVNGRKEGFEYKVEETPAGRLLRIELASPVRPDTVAQVSIVLRHIPNGWDSQWNSGQTTRPAAASAPSRAPRELVLPLMHCRANTVSGIASVQTAGDLESRNVSASAGLKEVSVGRMAALGLGSDTQSAWSYAGGEDANGQAFVRLDITKRTPRLTAQSVGLVSVMPGKLIGDYRVTYRISRASTTMLYLLVDKSIGNNFTADGFYQAMPLGDENPGANLSSNANMDANGLAANGNPNSNANSSPYASGNQSAVEQARRVAPAVPLKIVSKSIVEPSAATAPLGEALAAKYNLWQLVLDGPTSGIVNLMVRYESASGMGVPPMSASASSAASPSQETHGQDARATGFDVPMVRPIGAGQYNEVLAIEAAQELAVTQKSVGVSEIDAIELPVLPAPYKRLLWAFRLDSQTLAQTAQTTTQSPAVRLTTTAFDNYAIPVALAARATYTTYVGPDGSQRTSARFDMLNSGLQFLAINLPPEAQLWSIRIGEEQAKPKKGLANQYLVSLPRMSIETPVEVVYACKPPACTASKGCAAARSLAKLSLGAVTLDGVPVNEVTWNVVPPPGYMVTGQQSHMQADRVYRPTPAYETVFDDICPMLYSAHSGGVQISHMQSSPITDGSFAYQENAQSNRTDLSRPMNSPSAPRSPTTQPAPEGLLARQKTALLVEDIDDSRSMTTVLAAGRYTLPIELVQTPGEGQSASFSCLGQPALAVTMASEQREKSWWALGFGLFAVIGIAYLRRGAWAKLGFIAGTLVIASLIAIWSPSMTAAANGAFHGVLALIPLYIVVAIVRRIARSVTRRSQRRGGTRPGGAPNMPAPIPNRSGAEIRTDSGIGGGMAPGAPSGAPSGAAPGAAGWPTVGPMIALAAAMAIFAGTAFAQPAGKSPQARPAAPSPFVANDPAALPCGPAMMPESPLVFPYDDPATLAGEKVLVPYGRFVAAWNAAHPDRPLEIPSPIAGVALADVKYEVAVSGDHDSAKAQVILTATVVSPGKLSGQIELPMAFSRMAVVEATFSGKAASLKVGPGSMVLPLSAADLDASGKGQLRVVALARPQVTGDSSQRGSLRLGLPALPGAVMAVTGLDSQSLLEADLDSKPSPWPPEPPKPAAANAATAKAAGAWTLPLGDARDVLLRWSPKSAPGGADKTLSAVAGHEVYFFNWGVLGQTTIDFTFSAGEYDHFAILLPAGLELRDVAGPNIRDHNVAAEVTQDGQTFKVVDVRLYRPAARSYHLAIQWIAKLPALDKPQPILLPQASQVGRESGTLALYASGGINLKVADVSGGRRAADSPYASADTLARLTAEEALPVAKYYWPYRPFAITVQLSRPADSGSVRLSQLVRISQEQSQLFAQATLKARQGLVYGGSFMLPSGYELLSAVGSDVADWYIQTVPTGRLLHVSLRGGVSSTNIAIALVRDGAGGKLERFDVPVLTAIDPQGRPLAEQTGQLAVQVAKSLDAQTAGSENLKAIVPSATAGWLGQEQAAAVQFAYSYEKPNISLALAIKPLPTKKRVEMLAALNVQPTWAQYVYRMRYSIEGSPVDRVSFTMPSKYAALAQVESPSLRSATQADAGGGMTRWTVTLSREVTGILDVTVNFVLPVEEGLATISMPPVRPDSPDEYKAIVAVGNFSNRQLTAKDSQALSPLSWQQQQEAVGADMAKTLQYVWQAISDGWSLSLELSPAKASAKVPAVVDLLDVTTVIDPRGTCRYEAKISLQNRSEQFLKLRLPPGLELWSAIVADEPVKPVLPAGAANGTVLIPLIKTSAGGLPYDIKLYLGGKASAPLSGVTKIQPPAIAIEDMPVVRTTWSLRLPASYRYFTDFAGGNATPIAGTAEKMAIEVDALLDQAKRYGESSSGLVTSDEKKTFVTSNWNKLSGDIAHKNRKAQEYIDTNREKISTEDYTKLNLKLGGQRLANETLSEQWKEREQEANKPGANFNDFVNGTATNPGTDDRGRNKALEDVPKFFEEANKGNLEAVEKDLKQLDELKNAQENMAEEREITKGGKAAGGKFTGKPTGGLEKSVTGGKDANSLILGDQLKESEVYQGHDKEANQQIAKQAQQLMEKKEQLSNNALTLRLNTEQQGQQGQGALQGGGQGQGASSRQPNEPMPQSRLVPGPTARPNAQANQPAGEAKAAEGQTYDQWANLPPNTHGGAGLVQGGGGSSGGGANGSGASAGDAGAADRPHSGEAGYTGASYSMPISLPEGQVQLDFAHPSGEAVVAVWAVPRRLIDSASAAAALALAIVALVVARGLWRGRRTAQGHLAERWLFLRKFIAAALLVVAALLLLSGGLAGMIAVVAIVAVAFLVKKFCERPSVT